MKFKNKYSKALLISFILIIFITLASCGNKDLSRDSAAKKLKTISLNQITRQIETRQGPAIRLFESDMKNPNTFKQYEDTLNKLKSGGYINYEKKTDSRPFFSQIMYGLWYEVHFTDKLNPFIVRRNESGVEVLVAKEEFDTVTGIVKTDPNTRVVEFTTKVTPTKLISVFPLNEYETQPKKHEKIFMLYDDGWRMVD